MHEMSIAISLLELAEAEAAANGCKRISAVTVHYGRLAGVMPEALQMAFEMLIAAGPHAGAKLNLVELPLHLRCPFCQTQFGGEDSDALHMPCPNCGEQFGHIVEQGRELLLARLEAFPD